MRTQPLLRLLALALVASPVTAQADPLDDICVAAGPSADAVCEGFGPDYDADFITECTWIRTENRNGTGTYAWYATLVARRATAIRIECYQGSSYVSRTTDGQVGFVAATVDAPLSTADICTRLSIKYAPGNPWGRDPNTFFTFAPLCYPYSSIT